MARKFNPTNRGKSTTYTPTPINKPRTGYTFNQKSVGESLSPPTSEEFGSLENYKIPKNKGYGNFNTGYYYNALGLGQQFADAQKNYKSQQDFNNAYWGKYQGMGANSTPEMTKKAGFLKYAQNMYNKRANDQKLLNPKPIQYENNPIRDIGGFFLNTLKTGLSLPTLGLSDKILFSEPEVKQSFANLQKYNPTASTAGKVVGSALGMLAPIPGLKGLNTAVGKVPFLAPKAGDTVIKTGLKNIGRNATVGATVGAGFGLGAEGLDAAIDTRGDGQQSLYDRFRNVALSTGVGAGVGTGIGAIPLALRGIVKAGQTAKPYGQALVDTVSRNSANTLSMNGAGLLRGFGTNLERRLAQQADTGGTGGGIEPLTPDEVAVLANSDNVSSPVKLTETGNVVQKFIDEGTVPVKSNGNVDIAQIAKSMGYDIANLPKSQAKDVQDAIRAVLQKNPEMFPQIPASRKGFAPSYGYNKPAETPVVDGQTPTPKGETEVMDFETALQSIVANGGKNVSASKLAELMGIDKATATNLINQAKQAGRLSNDRSARILKTKPTSTAVEQPQPQQNVVNSTPETPATPAQSLEDRAVDYLINNPTAKNITASMLQKEFGLATKGEAQKLLKQLEQVGFIKNVGGKKGNVYEVNTQAVGGTPTATTSTAVADDVAKLNDELPNPDVMPAPKPPSVADNDMASLDATAPPTSSAVPENVPPTPEAPPAPTPEAPPTNASNVTPEEQVIIDRIIAENGGRIPKDDTMTSGLLSRLRQEGIEEERALEIIRSYWKRFDKDGKPIGTGLKEEQIIRVGEIDDEISRLLQTGEGYTEAGRARLQQLYAQRRTISGENTINTESSNTNKLKNAFVNSKNWLKNNKGKAFKYGLLGGGALYGGQQLYGLLTDDGSTPESTETTEQQESTDANVDYEGTIQGYLDAGYTNALDVYRDILKNYPNVDRKVAEQIAYAVEQRFKSIGSRSFSNNVTTGGEQDNMNTNNTTTGGGVTNFSPEPTLDFNNPALYGQGGGTNTEVGGGQQTDPLQDAYNQLMEVSSQFGNITPEQDAQIREQARTETQRALDMIEKRKQQILGEQSSTVNRIMQDKDFADKALNDEYFQRYMEARRNMANRGLLNSGLTQDAIVRLGMAKQDDIGRMESSYADRQAKTESAYQQALSKLDEEALNYNEDSTYQKLRDSFVKSSDSSLQKRSQAIKNWISTQQSAQKISNDYNFNVAKYFGFDPKTGAPTVQAQKLVADLSQQQINNGFKAEQIKQAWARIGVSQQNANTAMKRLNDQNAYRVSLLTNAENRTYVSSYLSVMGQLTTQRGSVQNAYNKESDKDKKAEYKQELDKIDAQYLTALDLFSRGISQATGAPYVNLK